MAKINNTSIFAITTPVDTDLVLGTDISNTSNDPDGETVNFRVGDLSGGLKFLASVDIANTANVSFTEFDNSKYDAYFFQFFNIRNSGANAAYLELLTSTDGGSTYNTGGSDYSWFHENNGTFASDSADDSLVTMPLTIATNEDFSGHLWLYSPHIADRATRMSFQFTLVDGYVIGGGNRTTAQDVDAIRFQLKDGVPSTPNMSTGTINMYGLKNS